MWSVNVRNKLTAQASLCPLLYGFSFMNVMNFLLTNVSPGPASQETQPTVALKAQGAASTGTGEDDKVRQGFLG